MSVHSLLVRNTAWYAAVTIVGLVSGLVMSVILARGLGPALMGNFSYLLWVERTMAAFALLGYAFATVRYTAEAFARGEPDRAWGVVRTFMRRQLVTTTIVAAALLPLILWLAPADLRAPFVVVALSLFPITIEAIYSHALQGAQRYDITARTSTIKMSLQLLVAAVVIVSGAGLFTLIAALTTTLLVSSLIQRHRVLAVYREGRTAAPAPLTAEMRSYLLPLSIVAVLDAIVWDRSEVFFLALYASPEQIAFYSLAFGLATRAMIIPEIAVGALLPAFSALHGRGAPEEFGQLYRTALRYVALLGAPLVAVVLALAPAMIVWLYGDAYLPAAPLVGALALVALVSAMRKVAWSALRAVGDRRCALTATWVAAIVNVALAAALIPVWTTTGAVLANSAAQLTATVWAFVGIARAHRVGFPTADLVKIGVAGAVALVVTWGLAGDAHDLPRLVVSAAAGFVVFAAACIPARVVRPGEWAYILNSTRRLLAARAPGATTP